MTMSFLASVRRNQRQWMVVLTILSIFAFLFDDVIRGANNMSSNSNALFIAVLCAGAMSILGYPRKHTVLYGAIGFVAGGGAALIGTSFAGSKPLVRTSIGNFSRRDLNEFRNRRIKADQFLVNAVRKIDKEMRAPSFGDLSDSSMVAFAVLQHEARRMGVSVSDEAVNRFLKEATQDKLGKKEYQGALRETGLGESDLFDIIRSELEVQIVGRLMSPPANVQQLMPQLTQGQLSGRVAVNTPEQLWQEFRKLNVQQGLTAVALPVTEFVGRVPEPTEAEVRQFFERYKDSVGDSRGNPGFLEFPKVKLAYLEVSNIEAYEKNLPEATEQEIVDYYLAHREDFKIFDIPESPAPKLPDLKSSTSPVDSEATPADAASPANGPDATTNAPAAEGKSNGKPTTPEKSPGESPKEEIPSKSGSSNEESPCGEDPKPADAEASKTTESQPAAPKSGDEPAKADKATPPAPALPEGDAPADATQPALPSPGSAFPKIPEPRYRELDADLKLDIREKILLQKAFDRMGDAADKALEAMMELGLKYQSADPKEREKLAASFPAELKKYAEANGLEYRETKELTRTELAMSLDEQIGSATDPQMPSNFRQRPQTVADEVFQMEPSGRAYRLSLYSPRRADTPKAKYSYWKTSEIPARVPDLKNELVRQKVVDAWKFEKARVLAEERAKELADLIKAGGTDVSAALSGQTINGTKESPAVTVRETPRFSWLRTSQSLPSIGLSIPVESFIDGIDQPGPDFMKTVFEDLNEGDAGAAVNNSRTVFYAVRVHDRDAAGSEADGGVALQKLQQQFLKEKFSSFIPTPYEFLGAETQQSIDARWRANFNKRYAIVFEESEDREVEQ